ncbi:MAG: glycosyltransferase family 2 protein, partial [Dehalococcoidia bacterium]|nr:glycosyltransferase family 2 protein [Dehalococcoidia bacterium]
MNRVLDCVERQTLPPLLWVVVDDASTDNSGEILRTAQLRIGNLCVLRLPEAIYEAGTRYAAVCRKGFEHGLMLLNADGCCPAYVGLLDGDILLPDDYFERLVNRFGRDPSAGIMSGVVD